MRRIAALILVALLPACVYAVCGEPHPRLVCAEYFQSQAVVEAKLARSTYIASPNDMDGHIYEMKTEKILRGNPGKSFDTWEENSSGRATFDWTPGRSYLLFLSSQQARGWVLDGCGNSGPLTHAADALKEIREIPSRSGGLIQVIIGGDSFTYSVRDARVQAISPKGSYSATTNDHGVAQIRVPSGQYSVTVPGHQVQAFDFTYEYPEKVTI